MRKIVALALIMPFFFIGCGGKTDGGLTATNDFNTQSLGFFDIQGNFTLQQNEGLNFEVTTQSTENVQVYFYSKEGNLSSENVDITADAYVCSGDSYVKSCTLMNDTANETLTFSIENLIDNSLSFKVVAFHSGEGGEGDTTNPVSLTVDSSHNGHVDFFQDSYYTFEKSGTGAVTITLQETDTMSDAMENMAWYLTNNVTGTAISVTDMDNNTSTVCNDAYADGNVTCTATGLSNGTVYRIRVVSNGESPYAEYKLLVTE